MCLLLNTSLYLYFHHSICLVQDNKLVTGSIQQWCCKAEITIYIPVDSNIHKAIIIPGARQPHNHPSFPQERLTLEAKEVYTQAIDEVGVLGAIVNRIDNGLCSIYILSCKIFYYIFIIYIAPSTSKIFGSTTPQAKYPAFSHRRPKADLIAQAKRRKYPNGKGFIGTRYLIL
jgi:hypothetical protein